MEIQKYRRFFYLVLIAAGFLAANFVKQPELLQDPEWPAAVSGIMLRVLVFWFFIGLQGSTAGVNPLSRFLLRMSAGLGSNLLYQAFLSYAFLLPGDLRQLVIESSAAAFLLVLGQLIFPEEVRRESMLIAGQDHLFKMVLSKTGKSIAGSLGAEYFGVPYLGELTHFDEAVSRNRPTEVIVGASAAAAIPPQSLWRLPLDGISVYTAGTVYERLLRRVPISVLQPTDLVLSPALRANSRVMAIQAIYTNLIGLALLFALSPILLVLSLLILLTSRGPIFDSIECAGFQKIPFQLFRFRLMGKGTGKSLTIAGRIISRLQLENLPQIINVVRGEMALFGPAPVRTVLARELTVQLPFFGHRFSVKPGTLGWAQAHSPRNGIMDELQRLEYDLYYIKHGSPLLDVEILLKTMTAWFTAR